MMGALQRGCLFQSALRFAVVSDKEENEESEGRDLFQSALRFAVVSDQLIEVSAQLNWLGFNPL